MGEKPDDRRVIDTNTRDLVRSGVDARKAEQMARDSMRKVDREMREKGKR